MFRPVGSQPPSVYWRRRIIVFGSVVLLVVLLVLTLRAATSGNGATPAAAGTNSATDKPSVTSSPPRTTVSTKASTVSSPASTKSSSTPASPTRSATSSTPPARCQSKGLAVIAVLAKSMYKVGDQPVVEMQVTNSGPLPCVQDLADKQIELKVYNGESRVWGSHDCEVKAGTDDRTLGANRPVRVSITWSGLTSQPKCAGTRQRVGAGTYTLYAVLSGRTGRAAQFSIS